jgi:hypothetical protein
VAGRLCEPAEVVILQPAAQQPAQVDERLGAEHALHDLLLRHFEREHGDGHLMRDGGVQCHARHERRLAHGRAARRR